MSSAVKELTHFINGEFVKGKSGQFADAYNPSTGEVISKTPMANQAEIDEAVEAARVASVGWGKLSVKHRMDIMLKFRNLVMENIEELTEIVSIEAGKTLADSEGEILRGLESVDYALSAPEMLKGEYSVNVGGNIDSFSMHQPLGVVLAIAPFNFPIMVPFAMTSMALAVGNSVILKPSEKIPHAALYVAELWKKAGLPKGVWTVIHGDHVAADTLIKHDAIKAITFVGSTPIAEKVYHNGTAHNKRVAAFGGAKNHMIIMPDADIEAAADAFIGAAYGAASQRCMSLSVAMPVGQKTADKLVAVLKDKVAKLIVGPYTSKADFGPVISKESKESILKSIEKAVVEGAEMLVDGRDFEITQQSAGFYIGPTLLDKVTPNMEVYKKEVFGPVRIITRVNSLEEAIALINAHELGNGVTIFTDSGAAAKKFKESIEVGMVGVNVPIPIPVGYHNFGGWKRSKFGESHMFGPDTMRFFTKIKTVSERWPEKETMAGATFSFPSN